MSITIEHGNKKNYYAAIQRDENFDRQAWRASMIERIVQIPAREMFKHFPNHIALDENDKFAWLLPNLELDDDVALTFKHNICTNHLKLIS